MNRASTDPILRTTIVAFLVVLLTAAGARAGLKTCLTGTDPSVAGDASRLAAARSVIGGFGCDCSSYDGSPGKSRADYLRCVRKDIDVVVRYGYLRSQCRGALLKSLKNATCGWDPSLSVAPCIKKGASGKVSCAIKPSAKCIDVPGQFTQVACTASVLPSCADVADTNNDGLIGVADSGACAALPVCGNGVRESAEECDLPSAACAAGTSCINCGCATPAPTRTVTPPPGATSTPTTTPVPNASMTPTPTTGSGCCANATGAGMCIDSSTGNSGPFLCQLQSGTWRPSEHCGCQSPVACPGSCLPGTPLPTPTPTPCTGFLDNGDGTIRDCSNGLGWEKKDQSGGLHDVNNTYTWAGLCPVSSALCQPNAAAAAACADATGGAEGCAECSEGATCRVDPFSKGALTTIWDWLVQLNATNFAGHNDWQVPTAGQDGGVAQLETILVQLPICSSGLCVAPTFNTGCAPGCTFSTCSCTASEAYWSATTVGRVAVDAWGIHVTNISGHFGKDVGISVRAVRDGS